MSKLKLFAACIALALGAAAPAQAALVDGNFPAIKAVYAFSDFGTGDVVIEVQTPLPTCQNGFWLRATDTGFKSLYALTLTLYSLKTQVRVVAFDDQIWPGSGGRYCRIHYIGGL